jgi:hypothetical protein
MQHRKIILAVTIVSIAFFSCIKQVNVTTRTAAPILVVEGNITTDTMAYTVRLTYSGHVQYADTVSDQYLEKNASVIISDDLGNKTSLSYTHQGYYVTTDSSYIGKVGRSYYVTVQLANGSKYISVPEKIKAPVPVDSISVQYNSHFDFTFPSRMDVSISTKDPAQDENYYKWSFLTWVGRQTNGVSCGLNCIEFQYCYQRFVNTDVHILSDALINGNEIKNQAVGYSYIFTYYNAYVDIGQTSLTREAYQFWESYQAQQTRTGGILDPLPAAIKGNVYNVANADDYALGYFSASAVTHRRVILVPWNITPYLLQISSQQFIPDGFIACFDAFPNTISYTSGALQVPGPPGWENAEKINVYW